MSFLSRKLRSLLHYFLFIIASSAAAQDLIFEVDDLNSGLGQAPAHLDRSSPLSTMEALLDLAEANEFETAAHLLNLNTIPANDQVVLGSVLAQKLYEVVDRKVVVSWAELLDRPDALDVNATSDSAVAGQARRSILLWLLTIDDRPYPIRLDRIKVRDDSPVWMFSERSVANIEKLYEEFGPSKMEMALPPWMREDAFWNLKWWEVIGLPIMLFIAATGGIIAHITLLQATIKVERNFVTRLVDATRLPAIIFAVTLIISVISGVFIFSGMIASLLTPLLALGYAASALILVVNGVDRIIDQLVKFDKDDLTQIGEDGRRAIATKVSLARRMMIVMIVFLGTGIVMAEANVLRSFGFSLLASAGAITIVLGFAAREVLSNIMSSMQIALNQSARIGDKVVYKGHLCHVERINFTYVLLRVWTGVRLVVPVTEFVSETFENWTIKEPQMTRLIEIRVDHSVDIEKLRDLFFEILEETDQEELGASDEQKVLVTDQDVFGQEVTFCLSCANPNTSWAVSCGVRERLISEMQKIEETGSTVFPAVEPANSVSA